jgi:hypothetical protein
MSLQRQTRLRVSAQRVLCIEWPSPLPPGESITSSLPDEILTEIFAHLAPKDFSFLSSKYDECLPLTLVCKRWRRIYEPFLYQRLDLSFHGWQNAHRVRQLLENLESCPNLRGNTRAIHMSLSNPNRNTCNNIARIVALCNAISEVSLWYTDNDLPGRASPLFDAIQNLPCLETLRLSRLSLQIVLGLFDLPSLKTLNLSHYVIGYGGDLSAPWPLDVPTSQQDLDQLLPYNRYHTGRVTSLSLSNPSTPLRVTEHLLRWPARLQKLSLTSLTLPCARHSREYSLTNIERLLGMHCKSLRFIEIGIIPWGNGGMPDFSGFPYLEQLHLSTRQLLTETPSDALSKLAAPYLHHVAMSFRTEDQQSGGYREFATGQVRWLADFAALKTSEYPTSRLETIFVHFNPNDSPFGFPDFRYVTWPWVYLDEAAQIVAQHGLKLTYSKPGRSKQEWDEDVKTKRDAASRTQSEIPAFSAEI